MTIRIRKRNVWIFIAVMSVLILGFFGYSISNEIKTSEAKVDMTTKYFLDITSYGNYETSYTYMSKQTKEKISLEKFKESVTYPKGIFSDITNIEPTSTFYHFNLNGPAMIRYTGIVTYNDGYKGELSATYIKEDGTWKIYAMRINPELDRLKKFLKEN